MPRYRNIPERMTSREAAQMRRELEYENEQEQLEPWLEYSEYQDPLLEGRDFNHGMVPYSVPNRSPTRRDMTPVRSGQISQEEVNSLLGFGSGVARSIHGYDPESPWLTDRYGREYRNTGSGQRIRNNWLSNFGYNTLGYRGNAAPVEEFTPDFLSRREIEATPGAYDTPTDSYRRRSFSPRLSDGSEYTPQRHVSFDPEVEEPVSRRYPSPPVPPSNVAPGGKAYNRTTNINRPKVKEAEYGGCFKFANSEFITDVVCLNTGAFSLNKFSVNAGLYSSFPTLSQIGQCFIYYRFTKLQFRYVSTSSDTLGTTNVALGTVCMMLNENPAAADPTSIIVMQNFAGSKSFKPSLSVVNFPINVENQQVEWYFTRTNPTTVVGQVQLADLCNFYIATSGMSAGYVCGELHCDYEVELCDPFLNGSITGNQTLYYRQQLGLKAGTGSGTCDPVSGTGYGNMAMTLTGSSSGNLLVIQFPGYVTTGCYMIQLNMPGDILMTQDPCQWGDLVSSNIVPLLTPPTYTSNITIIQPHCFNANATADILYEYSYGPGGYKVLSNASTRQSCNVITGTPGTTITGNNWDSTICVTIYIQLGVNVAVSQSQLATLTFPGFQSAGAATAPATFFQGDILIQQVNPNCQYSWSSGQGSSHA